MKINDKEIENSNELLAMLNNGTNPLDYLESMDDVEFVSKALTHLEDDTTGDTFYNDMSEILLKALMLYVSSIDSETKSLKRCKELVDLETNTSNSERKLPSLFDVLEFDNPAKMYYKSIEIAPEKAYFEICNKLSETLSKINL